MTAFDLKGGDGLPYFVGKDLRPSWNLKDSPAPRTLQKFEKVIDQKGSPFNLASLKDKVAVINFFFTSCTGICPITTRKLIPVQASLKGRNDVVMLSFSITPSRDNLERLQQFASNHKVEYENWRLLTGERREIYTMARDSFNADTFLDSQNTKEILTPDDFLHSEHVYLLDKEQNLRGIYQGRMTSSINKLIKDVKTLL